MRIGVTLLKAPLGHKGPLVQIGRKIIINNFIDFIFDMKISVPKQRKTINITTNETSKIKVKI